MITILMEGYNTTPNPSKDTWTGTGVTFGFAYDAVQPCPLSCTFLVHRSFLEKTVIRHAFYKYFRKMFVKALHVSDLRLFFAFVKKPSSVSGLVILEWKRLTQVAVFPKLGIELLHKKSAGF